MTPTLRAVSPHCPTVAHTVPHCLFYDEFSPADMEEHHGAVPHVPVRGVVDEADASFKAFKQKGMDPAEINRIVLDSCSALGMPPTLACITLWSEYMESEPLAVFFRLLQVRRSGHLLVKGKLAHIHIRLMVGICGDHQLQ